MVLEVADFRIQPGQQAAFEEAIQRAVATVLSKAEGFVGFQVQRCLESPERYLLLVDWQTLDDHMTGFREGPLFGPWRAIVGPFFAAPPIVEHFERVVAAAG